MHLSVDRPANPAAAEEKGMSHDHELEQYVHSFTTSSDRVRRLILISLVASVLTLVAFWNTLGFNWLDTRAFKARIAYRNELWDDPEGRLKICRAQSPAQARFVDDCEVVAENVGWVLGRRHSQDSLKAHLEKLEQVRVERSVVRIPWLGVDFDINDLGAFSAISLALLSMTLCFAMSRQHENLYLCLWKVRRIADREGRDNDGESQANFLYHALAMAQVFTRPPTLARWRPSFAARLAARILLFVPMIVQLLVTVSNLLSFDVARDMNPWAASLSMSVQLVFLILLIAVNFACFIYSRTSDLRWREAFFAINPHFARCLRTPWLDWMKLRKAPSWDFAVDDLGDLYVQHSDGIARPELRTAWTGWRLTPQPRALACLESASQLPDGVRKVLDGNGGEYRFQPSSADRGVPVLVCITKEGCIRHIAGGREEMSDGTGPEAGFRSPRSLLYSAEHLCLFVLDGASLRCIDVQSGEVTTLGMNPLGGKPRALWPLLPGLAADGDRLLVADYDEGCVRVLGQDGSERGELYRSRGDWSPVGVAAHAGQVYVLEHRALIFDRILGYRRPWGRVWFLAPAQPCLLLEISRGGAVLAGAQRPPA